ncbi:MAG: outer membrane beta-barrel protein [Deltaproteobacteria bacterium]|nr:outer membrane beta-barrel protein [Deltaproteobacteria bacterium]
MSTHLLKNWSSHYEFVDDIKASGEDFITSGRIGTTFSGKTALGISYLNNNQLIGLRTEAEIGYSSGAKRDLDFGLADLKIKADATTFMVNQYVDFKTGSIVTPYVGFGIGAAVVDVKASIEDYGSLSKSETNFAFDAGVGLGVAVTDNVTLDVGYRYNNLGSLNIDDELSKAKIDSHEFLAGVRFNF